ncbi:MAG: AAA family ATPase [Solirubrobacteraceae bacterium]
MIAEVRYAPGLIGRAAELETLLGMVDRASEQSAALVIRGQPGIGKTSLLRATSQHATDTGTLVLKATGVQSEVDLAFSGVHQLLVPVLEDRRRSAGNRSAPLPGTATVSTSGLDRLRRLPEPQRDALAAVLGLGRRAAPDRFLVGLALLSLLSDVAAQRPLLCVVDDAQSLDPASAQALAFVARRLPVDSLVMVLAEPAASEYLFGLPQLVAQGLGESDARQLMASAVRGPIDHRVRERILAEARGNPLALLELSRSASPDQPAGAFARPDSVSPPRRSEEAFLRQLDSLSAQTRLLLLVAAAEPIGDPAVLARAASALGVSPEQLAYAESTGLLEIGARVRFPNPLLRCAAYRSAATQQCQAVHVALAQATDPVLDPDRRAWHLAAAACGADEDVASELEHSAGRAQAHGGLAAAAAFLDRAVVLTRDPQRWAPRALAAAQANLDAGSFDAAQGLLASAEARASDELQRARVELLRGQIAFASSGGDDAARLLLRAAKRLGPLDLNLAHEAYLAAWGAALFAGRLADADDLVALSLAARSRSRAARPSQPPDLLVEGLAALVTEGRTAAAPALKRAATAYADQPLRGLEASRWGWLTSVPASILWDAESWHATSVRQTQAAREEGALAQLPIHLNGQAMVQAWQGDFAAAAATVAEAHVVAATTGSRIASHGALLLAALRGREPDASGLIEATIEDATIAGHGIGVQYAHWAAAVLFNGLGRYEEALVAARQASDDAPELFVFAWSLPELIEAANRCGNAQLGAGALERLTEATAAAGTDWALSIEARSRALLSAGETADRLYREAIERLAATRLRPELARAHLLYGEWLRRENRRVDARTQLHCAYDMLAAIGMEAFAKRARIELLATGERVRRRTIETRDELTAQEHQIARLACDGLSNPQIGSRLFISHRTVEWHLRKVFSKLGISSRRELRNALRAPATEPISA